MLCLLSPGSVAIIWFLLWLILVTESPVGHPGISESELHYIQSSVDCTEDQGRVNADTLSFKEDYISVINRAQFPKSGYLRK